MYWRALDIAIHAASNAAHQIVSKTPSPGVAAAGITGDRDILAIDAGTGDAIRDYLSNAFPAWGIVGTPDATTSRFDSQPESNERHVWIIDPGPATVGASDRLTGLTISIALLRNGVPVLGVVHAVFTPHGAADCFSWAEGCGEVHRNGSPAPRDSWPDLIDAYTVVAVPASSESDPRATLKCVAPGRFLAVDDLAYRLALTAVGEADGAVSYSTRPTSREAFAAGSAHASSGYCAGHALLIAAGGTLVDQDGISISYLADGTISRAVHGVFAGSRGFVETLTNRPWHPVSGSGFDDGSLLKQFVPLPTTATHRAINPDALSRAQGCLLGQFSGDSLGSLVEFKSPDQIARMYPDGGPFNLVDGGHFDTIAGQPTDDSEMALMLARTLIDRGGWDAEATGASYARWCHGWLFEDAHRQHSYPNRATPFDIGNTTSMGLGPVTQRDIDGGEVLNTLAQTASTTTQANGALMRVAPLGVWGSFRPTGDVADAVRADASLTHPNRVCIAASATFALTIAHAVRTHTSPRDLWNFARNHARHVEHCEEVADAIDSADVGPPEDFQTNMGWVLIAIRNAFYRLLHSATFQDGVIGTVRAGGDTDTNAAIAGALLGATYGRDAVPAQWRRMIVTCRPAVIPESDGAAPRIMKPRPAAFWPADAFALAQRLLEV